MPTSRPMQTSGKLGEILEYYSDIDELKGEMEEWRDNTPESLQSTDRYSMVEQAAETLGGAHSVLEEACSGVKKILESIPTDENEMSVLDLPVAYTEYKMYKGYHMPRWVRLANPCAALEAAMGLLDTYKEGILPYLTEENKDSLAEHIGQIGDALSDLQSVEFPTMFG